jgi:hypothetical protein
MRIMPTTSWRQRIVCASVAAAASCSALTLGVIFASRYVPSVTSEAIAAKIEQQRLARIEAEREFVDLRSDTARYAPLTDQEIVATQSPERKLESVDGASRSGADFRLRIEQRAKEAKDRKAPANQKPMWPADATRGEPIGVCLPFGDALLGEGIGKRAPKTAPAWSHNLWFQVLELVPGKLKHEVLGKPFVGAFHGLIEGADGDAIELGKRLAQ